VIYDLRLVPLFAGLPTEDLAKLDACVRDRVISAGDTLFRERDEPESAYIVAEGEIEILKESAGRSVRIAVSGPGDVVGEMGLVSGEPRNATVKALTDGRLVEIPKACLDELLATSVATNQALFDVFISRWREQESRVRQSERMAQIGVLAAGLAHEMNNPAAAVSSGVERLREALDQAMGSAPRVANGERPIVPSQPGRTPSAIERSDLESDLEDALERLGVERPWHHAAILTEAGFVSHDLEGRSVADILAASANAEVETLLAEIAEGAHRLSELVGAMKSYSFLDQAPVQDVDVVRGIEDTLLILRSKLRDISIDRRYAEDLPTITAYGSQLNQVWTNLLDNAADAITETGTDGTITIRAYSKDDRVIVEIENDGPEIPTEVRDRIFEAFFTTKDPGKGTGLGLDTAYNIVVNRHRGELAVTSSPQSTVFTVTLPITQNETT
jgi:signal transduction histidine kinase